MHIDLSGKTAIVTGSTEGIGEACAVGLLEAGAAVVLNGRKKDSLDASLATLRERFPAPRVTAVVADLATADGCAKLVEAVPAADILVNNVGIYGPRPFFEVADDEWALFFQTNVMSGVRLSRAYMPGMLERDWGRIVFISSESAINIPADMIHYGFTKTAMLSLSRGLAKLGRGTNVTVNAVLPGPTMTKGVADMLADSATASGKTIEQVGADFVKTHRSNSIIQRMATSEEVASMVVYVCSPQASATTGAALRVEGGIVESLI